MFATTAALGQPASSRVAAAQHAANASSSRALATDTCGYSGGASPGAGVSRASQKFNEIGILEGLTITNNLDGSPKTVNVFYSDEHALPLGKGDVTPWNPTYQVAAAASRNADDAGAGGNDSRTRTAIRTPSIRAAGPSGPPCS